MPEVTTTPCTIPSTSRDILSELLREGAQQMLAAAIEAEVSEWIESHAHVRDGQGHRQVVRNGYLPEREITTGIGPVKIRQPRVHDRRLGEEREAFSSKILPPYLRKTRSIEELLPWLYLKGISTGGFNEALSALVGPECPGLSASTVSRLLEGWQVEYQEWSQRSLADKHSVYLWVDGVHFKLSLGALKRVFLVLGEAGRAKCGKRGFFHCETAVQQQIGQRHAYTDDLPAAEKYYAAFSIRIRSKSKPARPYICRFSALSRWM